MKKQRDSLPGGMIPKDLQISLVKGRKAATTAYLKTDRNKWFYAFAGVAAIALFTTLGWMKADRRFAENVRVAWVKMAPDGTTNVEYDDGDKPVDFFRTTVESKLSEWIEKRFSKRRATIATDYGFAKMLMSPQLQTDFMDNKHAAEEAAKFIKCDECDQTITKTREIQLIDKDLISGSKNREQYTALIFTTDQNQNKNGRISSCSNKIITVIFDFRPRAEIIKKREELRYNPLGMEIIQYDPRDDPTPISLRDCQKM